MGQRVRRLRERHGWTISDLAKMVGVAPSTVGGIENGAIPTLWNGLGIAEAFGVSPFYIGFGKTEPPCQRPPPQERR